MGKAHEKEMRESGLEIFRRTPKSPEERGDRDDVVLVVEGVSKGLKGKLLVLVNPAIDSSRRAVEVAVLTST